PVPPVFGAPTLMRDRDDKNSAWFNGINKAERETVQVVTHRRLVDRARDDRVVSRLRVERHPENRRPGWQRRFRKSSSPRSFLLQPEGEICSQSFEPLASCSHYVIPRARLDFSSL